MKTALFSLFILLHSGALFAQFDELYSGYYKSDNETEYCFLNKYSDEEFGYLGMTEDEKKVCSFAFALSTDNDAFGGYATKKGNGYVSAPNEYSPEITFVFKMAADGETRMVEITKKGGTKMVLTHYVPTIEDTYYDEEYSDSTAYGYYGYTDEEPTVGDLGMDIRSYSRSDGAELIMIFSEESVVFSIHVPARKSCSDVMIEGVFDSPNLVNETYIYTNEEQSYTLEAKATDSGWQMKCVKGECFDRKNKCGVWKEAFMLNN